MSDDTLIADLVRAGVAPELIQRVADLQIALSRMDGLVDSRSVNAKKQARYRDRKHGVNACSTPELQPLHNRNTVGNTTVTPVTVDAGSPSRARTNDSLKTLKENNPLISNPMFGLERGCGGKPYVDTVTPTVTPTVTLQDCNHNHNRRQFVDWFAEQWNTMARRSGLARMAVVTDARERAIGRLVKDCEQMECDPKAEFGIVIGKVGRDPLCLGKSNGKGHDGWRADVDWVLNPRNFWKMKERMV